MGRPIRQVRDSRTLAAMAHPLRRRLLELLQLDGPASVGTLAERTGSAPGNVSHHLRVLAEAALVEEAPEHARDRRERWWRTTGGALRWSSTDFTGEVDRVVADAAASLNLDRHTGIVRDWLARSSEEPAWDAVAFSTDTWLRLTPEELAQLSGEVEALLERWRRREPSDDDRPRELVFVFAHAVPGRP